MNQSFMTENTEIVKRDYIFYNLIILYICLPKQFWDLFVHTKNNYHRAENNFMPFCVNYPNLSNVVVNKTLLSVLLPFHKLFMYIKYFVNNI